MPYSLSSTTFETIYIDIDRNDIVIIYGNCQLSVSVLENNRWK